MLKVKLAEPPRDEGQAGAPEDTSRGSLAAAPEAFDALDPVGRRYVLREMLKSVRSLEDLDKLGIDQAIKSCRSSERVYDMLSIILEIDEPWAREYVVKVARAPTGQAHLAQALLLIRDEPWAQQALGDIFDSTRGQRPLADELMMTMAADANTQWADEFCRSAFFSSSAEERAEWARRLLSDTHHFVGDDDIRRELFNDALLDADPAVAQAAVGFLLFQSQRGAGGAGWTSELLTNTFDRGDRSARMALLGGLQEELVLSVSGTPDRKGRAPYPVNVTAVSDLLERALECQDSTVRELAQGIIKNLEQMVDVEGLANASSEYAQQLRSWASQLSE